MEAAGAGFQSGGSLESRFFIDDGCWRDAPILTGQTSFEPLPDVHNILVTGGEGFIASYLIRHLVTKYPSSYNIISFDKLDYCSSLNNSRLLDSFPNFRFYHGDIMSQSDVLKCLQTYKIDTIFHLAAQSHVDLSFGNSFTFTHNNVMGTHVLLESAKVTESVRRFYHISTDEVYGEVPKGEAELHEESPLHPTNPYSASKACAEMMVRAYVKSFALPVVMIRLNNVYGPHQPLPQKSSPNSSISSNETNPSSSTAKETIRDGTSTQETQPMPSTQSCTKEQWVRSTTSIPKTKSKTSNSQRNCAKLSE
ncbi:Trifunctional UDP-glucose 4,6-dehydratase [Cercospora beticola]|uniref:Trifunctional UDP-glucose 4,6-dehydratase n=1 Tax=Cercospora beticola TaxID=122368 RepID=A0A2G5HKE6_CERBT|nr:Trifunctional UDP-glucose 4,6-dehydratase [Cercospora beticola]PIA92985.1 Trifunctional UDP-glucose 4,6-dehydratase [Cercospora beticola]